MLNQRLYEALIRAYGHVRVSNEGMPAVMTAVPQTAVTMGMRRAAGRHLEPVVRFGGEQYHICCPFCGDRRYRLYISHNWDSHVDIEGVGTVYAGKRANCFNEDCLADRGNHRRLEEAISAHLDGPPVVITGTETACDLSESSVDLPDGMLSLKDPRVPPGVIAYLAGRGYDLAQLADVWGVGAAWMPFFGTVAPVFPIVQQGLVKGWQARYPAKDRPDKLPRWHTMAGTRKSWLLYNMDSARHHQTVVLTEGVFDAISVGQCAVAMFGKDPSPRQCQLLKDIWGGKTLIWIPDNNDPESLEASDIGVRRFNLEGAFRGGAHRLLLPAAYEDAGECPHDVIWRCARDAGLVGAA